MSESETSALRYNGVERRRAQRRQQEDRRGDVRFDLSGDRRLNNGRREGDQQPQFW